MAMTKEGVCSGEKEQPKEENLKTANAKLVQKQSCGEDTLSRLADKVKDQVRDDNHD